MAVTDFLARVSAMTREEIELAMGRLADSLTNARDATEQLQIKLKGSILKTYLNLRTSGVLRQSRLRRFGFRGKMKKYFEDVARGRHMQETQQYLSAKKSIEGEHLRLVDAWRQEQRKWTADVKKLPFFERLFRKPEPPVFPRYPQSPVSPALVEDVVARSRKQADMSEFLIATVFEFALVSVPDGTNDVSRDLVKVLAG
jgi:hypothetical protein